MKNVTRTKKHAFTGCLFGLFVLSSLQINATTCANAILISSFPVTSQALVCGTGNDIGSGTAPTCGNSDYRGGNEALYYFVAPSTGNYTISISGQTWTGIFVYQGCPGQGGTTCVGSTASSLSSKNVIVALTSGNTYYVLFDTWPTPNSPCSGTFSISAPTPPPSNDLCSGAIDLGGLISPLSSTTTGATADYSYACNSNSSPDLVYYIDVPNGQQLTIGQTANGYDSENYVHYGGSCPGTTQIACFDDPDIQNIIWTNSTGSTQRVYWVQDGFSGASDAGTFTLAWSLSAPPAVPNCATLNTPANGATNVVRNTPLTWTPAGTGGTPTGYKVYLGTATNPSLTTTVTHPTATYTPSGQAYSTTYYWRIVPTNGTGDAVGCTTEYSYTTEAAPPPPANDNCAGAVALTSGSPSASGNTNDATQSLVSCTGGSANDDVWFRFTSGPVPSSSTLLATPSGADPIDDMVMEIFTGSCASLSSLVCVDDGLSDDDELYVFTPAANTNYFVRIYNYFTDRVGDGQFTLSITSGAFPLELASFSGKTTSSSNMLLWETLTEKNVQWHIVERSVDGVKWMEIGKKAGQMESYAAVKYELEDRAPLAKAYYRLRSVDYDGAENLSNTISLTRKGEHFGITAAFPSPTKSQVTVQFESLAEETVTIQVTDFSGRLVLTQEFAADNGINEAVLQLGDLQTGVYLLRISNATSIAEPMRIVKE